MSNKRKPSNARSVPSQRAAREHDAEMPETRVRLSAPADILAVVPYLLGFHPSDSLVLLGIGGPQLRVRLSTRMDLPPVGQDDLVEEAADRFVQMVAAQSVSQAILVAYGEEPRAGRAAGVVSAALRSQGIKIRETLRADEGRYWSYECTDSSCCPPEGTPYDISTNPVAAAATVAGCVALPDRETLARSIASLGGITRVSMRRATARAEERLQPSSTGSPHGPDRGRLLEEGRARFSSALSRFREGNSVPSDDDTAALSVALQHLQVRDEAWLLIDADDRAVHLALWTHVVRRAEERYVAAPASLLAFAAWQDGNGALASIAVDRALDADPEYSMAHLLRGVLDHGIPPGEWEPRITAEDLANLYAA